MKDLLYENGFRKILLLPFNKSLCQRGSVMVAAGQMGFKDDFKKNFKMMGVKWFHILPYAITNNPLVIFNKEFWVSTFFQPYYESKYFNW